MEPDLLTRSGLMLAPPQLALDDPRAFDRAVPSTALGKALAWSAARREAVLLTSHGLLWIDVARGAVSWVASMQADRIAFAEEGLLAGERLLTHPNAAPRSSKATPLPSRWPRSSGRCARFDGYRAEAKRDKKIEITDPDGKQVTIARVGQVDTLTFTPDGASLVVANHAHVCKRWDWRSGKAQAKLVGHGDFVRDMEFVDERHLLTACYDGGLRIWDGRSGACLGAILAAYDGGWLAIAADGAMESTPGLRAIRYGYRENSAPGYAAFRVDVIRSQPGVVRRIFAPIFERE